MWNDLRPEEESADYDFGPEADDVSLEKPPSQTDGIFKEPILGMSPPQRLVVALFLLVVVCVLGILFLIVSQKLYLF
jgi:hypothetical protein